MTEPTTTAAQGEMQAILDDMAELQRQRSELGNLMTSMAEALDLVRANHMPQAREKHLQAMEVWHRLEARIRANPQLFIKPRTVVHAGIKAGIEKGKGKVQIDDAKKTVALIKKHLPELVPTLIDTVEKPAKAAMATLPVADLKRIGASVTEAGDQVVIRPVEGELDKLLKALLNDQAEDTAEE